MQLRGCGTALVTPFHQDGSIDDTALRNLVTWQIESGIDFLVPCGTTGESPTLARAEHADVVDQHAIRIAHALVGVEEHHEEHERDGERDFRPDAKPEPGAKPAAKPAADSKPQAAPETPPPPKPEVEHAAAHAS